MILIGSRLKGIGIGLMGVVGVFIFVTVFGLTPADPPGDIMLIIISVSTLSATLEAAGGLTYLMKIAEKIIRRHPKRITIIAPVISFLLSLVSGTAHVIYSLLPIIADLSLKHRIRPERPMSASVIACQAALTGSPMSAATSTFAAILAFPEAAINNMMVCIPACFIGSIAAGLVMMRVGKELDDDPVFLEKMKDPEFAAAINQVEKETTPDAAQNKTAKKAVIIFAITILLIIICGIFPQILPDTVAGNAGFHVNADGSLKMITVIETITLTAAALMVILTGISPNKIVKASLFNSMGSALISVFGVVWMAATFMNANMEYIKETLASFTAAYPWTFLIAIFLIGLLMFSSGSITKTMMPLGLSLGLPVASLIPAFPAVGISFFMPVHPALLAAVSMDKTGTTRIGRFVINHSFMLPGAVTLIVSIITAFLLAKILL